MHDTHAHPVPPDVLDLLAEVCSRVAVPGVLLERDDAYPSDAELATELTAIRHTVTTSTVHPQPPVATRAVRPSGDLAAARATLARAQDGLVAALVAGTAHPRGFDAERVRVQADALLAKRRGLVARLLPDLAEAADFPARFAAYARTSPRPPGGSAADAETFARHHSGR